MRKQILPDEFFLTEWTPNTPPAKPEITIGKKRVEKKRLTEKRDCGKNGLRRKNGSSRRKEQTEEREEREREREAEQPKGLCHRAFG